jgi:hypothetical protein
MVASPPSSRIMLAGSLGQVRVCSAAHQYSSSVSPFHAKTGTPLGSSGVPCGPTTTAAAAWSWVEKMLQDAQRTCAPSATNVSISTAVCTVMCSEPETRAWALDELIRGVNPWRRVLGGVVLGGTAVSLIHR